MVKSAMPVMDKVTIDNGNGKDAETPEIMKGDTTAVGLIEQFRNDVQRTNRNVDLSKYYVMEGMQNKDKLDFFTEFEDTDDVLRMNTIQQYVTIAPLIVRKSKNMEKIKTLLQDVYVGHVNTHKTNMVSKNRAREEAYVRILSSDSSDSGVTATGFRKFFGVGPAGDKKK